MISNRITALCQFIKQHPKVTLLICLSLISILRMTTFNTDTNFASIFIEEMVSGYAGRTASLGQGWNNGGGCWQSAAFLPGSTLLTYLSFKLFGLGLWQFKLPFFIAALLGLWLYSFAIYRSTGLVPSLFGAILVGLSPLILSINESGLNENLYFLYFGLIFLMLADVDLSSPRWFLIFGITCGTVVFIKWDGLTVLPAMFMALIIWLFRTGQKQKILKMGTFCLGGLVFTVILLIYYHYTFGLEKTFELYRMMGKTSDRFRSLAPINSIGDLCYTLFVGYNKNMSQFNFWFYAFALSGFLSFPVLWKHIKLPGMFAFIFIAIQIPFLLIAAPFFYYKRFIPIIFALYVLGIYFWDALTRKNDVFNRKSHILYLSAVSAFSCAMTMLAYVSYFKGYWNKVLFNSSALSNPVLLGSILLISLGIGAIIYIFPRRRKALAGLMILSMCLSLGSGIYYFCIHHHRHLNEKIGKEIASIIKNDVVVCDESGLRFFVYQARNRIYYRSVNEMDYPKPVFKLINTYKPGSLVFTDLAYPFSTKIAQYYKNYKLIKTIDYKMPPYAFETPDGMLDLSRHRIYIYKRK